MRNVFYTPKPTSSETTKYVNLKKSDYDFLIETVEAINALIDLDNLPEFYRPLDVLPKQPRNLYQRNSIKTLIDGVRSNFSTHQRDFSISQLTGLKTCTDVMIAIDPKRYDLEPFDINDSNQPITKTDSLRPEWDHNGLFDHPYWNNGIN
jgi:hypothetical protein